MPSPATDRVGFFLWKTASSNFAAAAAAVAAGAANSHSNLNFGAGRAGSNAAAGVPNSDFARVGERPATPRDYQQEESTLMVGLHLQFLEDQGFRSVRRRRRLER